ncbi:MAG TPA: ester cyclase [Actinospica sp.]|nr:ester cyclase [Actinospica sp.]
MTTANRPDTSATTGSDPDIINVVRAFYEPFRTGDTAVYDEILTDDWIDIPLAPGQQQGPAGLPAQIAAFRQAMPDYHVTHEDIVIGGDRVAVRNTVSGTHQGAFMGYEPTGRRIEIRTIDIHQVRDNRIVVTWHLEDFAGLMTQLAAPTDAPVPAAWS